MSSKQTSKNTVKSVRLKAVVIILVHCAVSALQYVSASSGVTSCVCTTAAVDSDVITKSSATDLSTTSTKTTIFGPETAATGTSGMPIETTNINEKQTETLQGENTVSGTQLGVETQTSAERQYSIMTESDTYTSAMAATIEVTGEPETTSKMEQETDATVITTKLHSLTTDMADGETTSAESATSSGASEINSFAAQKAGVIEIQSEDESCVCSTDFAAIETTINNQGTELSITSSTTQTSKTSPRNSEATATSVANVVNTATTSLFVSTWQAVNDTPTTPRLSTVTTQTNLDGFPPLQPPPKREADILAEILLPVVLEHEWTSDYNAPDSYMELATAVETMVNKSMEDLKGSSVYLNCVVTNLTSYSANALSSGTSLFDAATSKTRVYYIVRIYISAGMHDANQYFRSTFVDNLNKNGVNETEVDTVATKNELTTYLDLFLADFLRRGCDVSVSNVCGASDCYKNCVVHNETYDYFCRYTPCQKSRICKRSDDYDEYESLVSQAHCKCAPGYPPVGEICQNEDLIIGLLVGILAAVFLSVVAIIVYKRRCIDTHMWQKSEDGSNHEELPSREMTNLSEEREYNMGRDRYVGLDNIQLSTIDQKDRETNADDDRVHGSKL